MASKTVPHTYCACGKRAFTSEHNAEKAMGRARTKRNRAADKHGSRRGVYRESRYYECPESGLFHLTSQSRREFATANQVTKPALTWEEFLRSQGQVSVDIGGVAA